jgi:hypothetical protein
MRRVVFARGLWLLVLIAIAAPALAQRTTGEIIGTVTDESGAILPGVTVTIRGAGVAGAPTVVTSEVGTYRFPALAPGDYSVEYTLQGFGTLRRDAIPVGVGAVVELKVSLKVSTLSETVTVMAIARRQLRVDDGEHELQQARLARRRSDTFALRPVNSAPGVSATSTVGSSTTATTLGSTTSDNVRDRRHRPVGADGRYRGCGPMPTRSRNQVQLGASPDTGT